MEAANLDATGVLSSSSFNPPMNLCNSVLYRELYTMIRYVYVGLSPVQRALFNSLWNLRRLVGKGLEQLRGELEDQRKQVQQQKDLQQDLQATWPKHRLAGHFSHSKEPGLSVNSGPIG